MSKRKIGIMVAVLVLLMAGTVWAIRRHCANTQVEKVKSMLTNGPPQRGQFEQFREEMRKLTPDQRQQIGEEMAQRRDRRENKEANDYFALPPDKRLAYLDKRIADEEKRRAEMEKRRKEWEQRRAETGQGAGGLGAGMGPGQGSPGQGQANAGGGPGGGWNRSSGNQSARRNQRLDNTSPQQRATQMAYRSAVQQRRLQLGLPANPVGGRGPGGR